MAGGLIDSNAQFNGKYDDLVQVKPEEDPWQATEPVTAEEQAHYDDLYADFMDKLYGPNREHVLKILKSSSRDLYSGVAQASFVLLKGVYDEYKRKEGEVPQAALFGEGGMIATSVDEIFKLANVHKLPGSDDINQYTAAQMDMMRRVGELLEKEQSDDAVDEAQDLLMDVEEAYNPGATAPPLGRDDLQDLDAIRYQEEARRPQVEQSGPVEAEASQVPGASLPEQQGLI